MQVQRSNPTYRNAQNHGQDDGVMIMVAVDGYTSEIKDDEVRQRESYMILWRIYYGGSWTGREYGQWGSWIQAGFWQVLKWWKNTYHGSNGADKERMEVTDNDGGRSEEGLSWNIWYGSGGSIYVEEG